MTELNFIFLVLKKVCYLLMQIKGFEAFFVVVVLIQLQTLDCELNANLLTMTMQTF